MKISQFCYCLLILAIIASTLFFHSLLAWLLLINSLTFSLYGADKMAARKGWQRVPEMTLLLFGVIGGWVGGLIAQQLFRHKTQKQPFKTWFMCSVVLNVMVVTGVGYWLNQSGIV